MKVSAHVYISGRVQGVFFRSQTRRKAHEHNITGWIKNLSDGRVEAVFEGEEKDVRILTDFCKLGPTGARVEKTEVILLKFTGEFDDFQIIW